ncbi:MAG: AAA family ATPase [Rikenellaceae bacterium]
MEEINRVELIAEELSRGVERDESVVGMFLLKSLNQTIREASTRADPKPLWLSLWYEGEVCCLFADSNLGKSIYAMQIADEIAKSQSVLYFDFELSDKQVQLRYTDDEGGLHHFPDNLFRVEISREAYSGAYIDDAIAENIEAMTASTGAKVLIIDNLTYLCNASEKGEEAGSLMMKLLSLKRKYNLSILVIAHTPKRMLSDPITQNDLAGSKKLFNLFDSVFAMGKSAKDSTQRYIKQIKVRYGSFTYDSDNVINCVIEKRSGFLQFVTLGYSNEREHLREYDDGFRADLDAKIKALSAEGKSYRAIAEEVGVSLSVVQRSKRRLSVSGVSGVGGGYGDTGDTATPKGVVR